MMLNGFERCDDISFLVGVRVEVINVFLSGIIYFLLHQLMHLDILSKKSINLFVLKKSLV